MNRYDPTAIPYMGDPLPLNSNDSSDNYLSAVSTMSLSDPSFSRPTYSTDTCQG